MNRLLILFIALCCAALVIDAKKVKVQDLEYTVRPHPEDCTKYILCEKGKCHTMSCHVTYVFDPATGTCTHRIRGYTDCDRRWPRRSRI